MNYKLKNYLIGVGWFLLSLICSSTNDIISKYTGSRLPVAEVTFFRFAFSAFTLIPFILYYGKRSLITSNPGIHVLRGCLLFFGITAWTYGLTVTQVTTGTVVSFSIPLFTLVFAVFFLKENIIFPRWIATCIGFLGIVITLKPQATDFNPEVLIFIAAAVAFAMLDILNKKFVIQESTVSMLFYSATVTAVLAAPAALVNWETPTSYEIGLLLLLGAGANLILFLLLRSFALIDVTASAPYRYFELLVSTITAFVVFEELPEKSTLYGACIIIPSTLFVVYSERKEMSIREK